MDKTLNDASNHFLNRSLIDAVDIAEFRAKQPFPWINPQGVIAKDKLSLLLDSMPTQDAFSSQFGYERKYGQQAHDHYSLEYEEGLELAPAWQQFVAELCDDYYRSFVCRFLGTSDVGFRFQWHMAPRGAAVPPHCDSRRKIGTHIFYMNTQDDWNPDWGGQTLILDDYGKFKRNSNPEITDFPKQYAATNGLNSSLIFGRGKKSWHAVRALECPEGALRKVFIIVYERRSPLRTMRKKATALLKRKSQSEVNKNIF